MAYALNVFLFSTVRSENPFPLLSLFCGERCKINFEIRFLFKNGYLKANKRSVGLIRKTFFIVPTQANCRSSNFLFSIIKQL